MRIIDWSSDVCSSDRKGNPKNHLTDDAIARIAAAYLKGEPVDGLMAVIDSKQAEANDYNLSPSRYISNGETKALREIPEIVKELARSEEHTSELQSLMRISYAVFCWKKKTNRKKLL